MKKSFLLVLLLMIFSLVLFSGCSDVRDMIKDYLEDDPSGEVEEQPNENLPGDEQPNDDQPNDDQPNDEEEEEDVVNPTNSLFEITDDSAETMTYSTDLDDALFEVLVAIEVANVNENAEEYAVEFEMIKEYLNYAKITEKQALALTNLVIANANLTVLFSNEHYDLTTALIKQILEFYKDVIGIIGNDAAGKFVYNLIIALAEESEDPEAAEVVETLKAVGYENYVLTSRVSFTILNTLIKSFSTSDVNFIAELAINDEVPTNSEIIQLARIAAKAIDAIDFDDSVWNQYLALLAVNLDAVIELLPEDGSETIGEDGPTKEEIIEVITVIKELLGSLGNYVNTELDFVSAVLRSLNYDFLKIMKKTSNFESNYNEELDSYVTVYYIDGQEVTADEYSRFEYKKVSAWIKLFVTSYSTLGKESKAKLRNGFEVVLAMYDEILEENVEEEYVYGGETSTFEDVIGAAETIIALDIDNISLGDIEATFFELTTTIEQYIALIAPYLYNLAFE